MGIMVFSLLWVMQDLYHQPYFLRSGRVLIISKPDFEASGHTPGLGTGSALFLLSHVEESWLSFHGRCSLLVASLKIAPNSQRIVV